MNKYIKAENTLETYLSIDFPVFIPYFPKILTLHKEEKILSLRLRSFLSYNQGDIHEPLSINQRDTPRGRGMQFQLCELSTSFSPYFC